MTVSSDLYRCSIFLLIVILVLLSKADAETALRAYHDGNARNLPARLKGMGVHGHFDMMQHDVFGLYVPDKAQGTTCRNQSSQYLDAILNYERWGLQMIDSSAGFPVGLFHGNLQNLGNFDECLDTQKFTPYDIQYCILFVKNLHKLPNTTPSWENTDHIAGGPPFLKPHLQIGVCLPASCNARDIKHHYNQVTAHLNLTVYLHKYSCTRNSEQKNIDPLDIATVMIIATIVIICLYATLVDVNYFSHQKKSGKVWRILNCFSLYQNGKNLLKATDPGSPLAVIHGLRTLTSLSIMYGHHILVMNIFPFFDYDYYLKNSESPMFIFAIMTELQVDTFLLINGILLYTGYHNLLLLQGRKFNLPLFYFHHLLRIGPSYLILMMMTMSVLRFLSEGPLWKYYVYGARDTCFETWWTHALFINNYVEASHQCIASTWYLALDMQLYLISPLILLPLIKHWKYVASVIIPLLIIIGNLLPAWITYVNNYPATNMFDRLAFRNDMYENEYTPTHLRYAPWLIGILTGYIIVNNDKQISKVMVRTCWTVFLAIMSVLFYSTFYLNGRYAPNNVYLNAAYNGMSSSLWVICLAWLVFACEMGYAGTAKKFLSWTAFQPFSRITYTMYLVGPILQFGSVAVRRSVVALNSIEGYKNLAGEILIILLIAPVYSMLFEAPFIQLNKIILHQGSSKVAKNDESCKKYNDITETKTQYVDTNIELDSTK